MRAWCCIYNDGAAAVLYVNLNRHGDLASFDPSLSLSLITIVDSNKQQATTLDSGFVFISQSRFYLFISRVFFFFNLGLSSSTSYNQTKPKSKSQSALYLLLLFIYLFIFNFNMNILPACQLPACPHVHTALPRVFVICVCMHVGMQRPIFCTMQVQ
jgi:hypothetical protein